MPAGILLTLIGLSAIYVKPKFIQLVRTKPKTRNVLFRCELYILTNGLQSQGRDSQLDDHKLSPQRRFRRLGLPHGYGCRVYADS